MFLLNSTCRVYLIHENTLRSSVRDEGTSRQASCTHTNIYIYIYVYIFIYIYIYIHTLTFCMDMCSYDSKLICLYHCLHTLVSFLHCQLLFTIFSKKLVSSFCEKPHISRNQKCDPKSRKPKKGTTLAPSGSGILS